MESSLYELFKNVFVGLDVCMFACVVMYNCYVDAFVFSMFDWTAYHQESD